MSWFINLLTLRKSKAILSFFPSTTVNGLQQYYNWSSSSLRLLFKSFVVTSETKCWFLILDLLNLAGKGVGLDKKGSMELFSIILHKIKRLQLSFSKSALIYLSLKFFTIFWVFPVPVQFTFWKANLFVL